MPNRNIIIDMLKVLTNNDNDNYIYNIHKNIAYKPFEYQ